MLGENKRVATEIKTQYCQEPAVAREFKAIISFAYLNSNQSLGSLMDESRHEEFGIQGVLRPGKGVQPIK